MRILVATLFLGDVEDPELYAAQPIIEWERTELGQWLHEHSYEQMTFDIIADNVMFGYRINIYAWLRDEALTYYKLKWS